MGHQTDWNKPLREGVAAHEKEHMTLVAGYLQAMGIQVGFLHEMMPRAGKARRIYKHLAATLLRLEDEVRRLAGLPDNDWED